MYCIRFYIEGRGSREVIITKTEAVYDLIGILEKSNIASRIHVFHCGTGSELDIEKGLEVIPFDVRQARDEAVLATMSSP
ncbi:hypothetical protein HN858_02960 [Candidatus Falkowbacteria bacterium]|nr:hypothetical protein [Candidatus Falkowbacteria bacterium]MBT5503392.1 hypothetical protein [Candidatus Falkowbacteria bacterium]MBT6574045.1 hypothetical protein [Candidatus Falkowbacteria bacterium]MBT7348614.1 hypothetical protein [Candidatus Falkowbacteria bacterium]MBT7500405.1 hypothetical protein [Candidatus Falkowbacteria bacterium]